MEIRKEMEMEMKVVSEMEMREWNGYMEGYGGYWDEDGKGDGCGKQMAMGEEYGDEDEDGDGKFWLSATAAQYPSYQQQLRLWIKKPLLSWRHAKDAIWPTHGSKN